MPSNSFWAGSEASYQIYLAAAKKFEALSPEAFGADLSSNGEVETLPRLYTRVGNVGLLSISGVLVNKETWWLKYAGITSYEALREAAIFALEDSSVDVILKDLASPGGQVAGCEDTANLLKKIDAIKPMYSFSDSAANSATYWIASASRKRFTSKTAMWGSIGVLLKHAEISRMRKEAGITDTIFRSGDWKGIGGSEEELSELAKKDFQEKTDYLASIFVDSVAENLNITSAFVDETMGQGRVFIGQQAVDVGLCNSVESFDAVIEELQKTEESVGGITMAKKGMTAQAVAALATGASPEAEASSVVVDETVVKEVETKAPEAAIETKAPEAEAKTEVLADDAADLASVLAKNELLTEQMKVMSDENITLKLDAKAHEGDVEAMAALKVIAASAVNNMQVAMGASSTDLSAHTAPDLVVMHLATTTSFESTFPVGGVAKVEDKLNDKPEASAEADNTGAVGF